MTTAIAALDTSDILSSLTVPMAVIGVGGPGTMAFYTIDTSMTRSEMLADIKLAAKGFLADMSFTVDVDDIYVFGAPQ